MNHIQKLDMTLIGRPGAPLVIHAFAEKAKAEIRDKQKKAAKKAKGARDPEAEFLAARYIDAEGRECAPVTAIKKAMVSAARAMDNVKMTEIRQAVFVAPTAAPASLFVPIEKLDGTAAVGVMREDAVTIGINTRGLSYRPEYAEWQLRVSVEYNSRMLSREQVVELAKEAGWGVGICEGRPEKSSALGWGRFDVIVN